MREIKFRAWWKKDWDGEDQNMMLYEVQDFYDTLGSKRHGNQLEPANSFGELLENPDQYVVMQFTGFHDMNNKEMYVSDIVMLDMISGDRISEIILHEKWRIPVVNFFGYLEPLHYYASQDKNDTCLKIIGNIYESPELLGKADGK